MPGGPNKRTPRHGSRIPVNNYGYFKGNSTASFKSLLATSKPTTSLNLTLGFSTKISRYKYEANTFNSGISAKSGIPLSTLTSKKSSFPSSSSFFLGFYYFIFIF